MTEVIPHMTSMLTTLDNPFDPFDDFDNWYDYDVRNGYNTCSYLARISATSDSLPDSLNSEEIERAIDEIVELNISGVYRKISR